MRQPADSIRIVFAGGGTGGHLYPAIAIADRIKEMAPSAAKVEIIFVGTKRGLEYRLRESLGYPLRLINIRGLVRGLTLVNLLIPFLVVAALIKSALLLGRFAPDIVVGTGGYVAWPVLKMAAFRKIPTVLQEQNSYPGVTTRQLAGRAKRIYLGFEAGRGYLKDAGDVVVTGNPVRAFITQGNRTEAIRFFKLDPDKKTILVLGGSQGARSVNAAVLRSLDSKSLSAEYQILWQTGKGGYKDVAAKAGSKAHGCTLFPFAERMDLVYAAADVAIARAGALTLAELAACGVPSVLIPYPYAAGDHQRKNAEASVHSGAAVMVDEAALASVDIIEQAMALFESGRLAKMKEALQRTAAEKKPAVDIIAEDILSIIRVGKGGQAVA